MDKIPIIYNQYNLEAIYKDFLSCRELVDKTSVVNAEETYIAVSTKLESIGVSRKDLLEIEGLISTYTDGMEKEYFFSGFKVAAMMGLDNEITHRKIS